MCSKPCLNGVCQSPEKCHCNANYSGDACEQNLAGKCETDRQTDKTDRSMRFLWYMTVTKKSSNVDILPLPRSSISHLGLE